MLFKLVPFKLRAKDPAEGETESWSRLMAETERRRPTKAAVVTLRKVVINLIS
jgi:hypothetical protein